jgi:hypothetical protein
MLEEARYTHTDSATDTGIICSDAKRPRFEFDHSPPSSAEVKKE